MQQPYMAAHISSAIIYILVTNFMSELLLIVTSDVQLGRQSVLHSLSLLQALTISILPFRQCLIRSVSRLISLSDYTASVRTWHQAGTIVVCLRAAENDTASINVYTEAKRRLVHAAGQ